ncbi:MAG: gamma-glutamylcyclotransferase [Pikeienuella sp.]
MLPVFFYGSLRDHELTEIVLGRRVPDAACQPAQAEGYATRRAALEAYPMLVPEPGSVAEGLVLLTPTEADLDRLAFFEEAEYALEPIAVTTPDGPIEAQHFRPTGKMPPVEALWDFETWRREDRAVAVEAAREYMAWYGRLTVEEIDARWPGIMIRARQRVRAAREPAPTPGGLRSVFGPGDLDLMRRERAYVSFLAVEELRLRHRRFDGGWSKPLSRSAVLWGDAVTLLPYDPARDRVLLIEQFRPAALARGDLCPWCIEVVAGRIDTDESAEETARREAREEAGLGIGRLVETGLYYTTPGLAAETIRGFVGEAELPHSGGLHGLDKEHEDIRAFVLDFEAAMAAVGRGEINTGPALVALLWLSANRMRLRDAWA